MSDDSGATNKAIVADFFATFSTGNVAAIVDALADGGGWWVSGRLEGMSGRFPKEEFGALLEGAKSSYRHGALTIRLNSMIAEGDKVAVEAEGHAELLDGRVYAPIYHFLILIQDGKIKEVREYMDTQHAKEIFFGD
jgi:ketosteroid isomerase-like protein